MAIQKAIRVIFWGIADGTSTSWTVKLAKDGDPYLVGSARPGGVGGRVTNWFPEQAVPTTPKGALLISGASSVNLAVPTSNLTITVPVKPAGERYEVVVDLLFS